jgi:hypothetical protein
MFFYKVYGLTIASELELPELLAWDGRGSPDVTITFQSIETKLENPVHKDSFVEVDEDACLLKVCGVARYKIVRGEEIIIDLEQDVPPGDVRLYLLGSVFGALLHQRGCFPLHASTILTPDGLWAFTGESGAGKSTLAAWLHYSQDWPVVSDDVAVLKSENGCFYLEPGPPRLKLWKDALKSLNISEKGLLNDLTKTEKYHLRPNCSLQTESSHSLSALFILNRTEDACATLHTMYGIEALQAVIYSIYNPQFGKYLNDPKRLINVASDLANHIKIYEYRRPWDLKTMDNSLKPLYQEIYSGNWK